MKTLLVKIGQTAVLVSESTGLLINSALRGVDKRIAEIDRNITNARESHNRQVKAWADTCATLHQKQSSLEKKLTVIS